MWKLVAKYINKKKSDKITVKKLVLDNGEVVVNPVNIASELNKFFCSVGKKLAESIEGGEGLYREEMQPRSMFLTPVTEQEVLRYISVLDSKKSSGPDYIPPLSKQLASTSQNH